MADTDTGKVVEIDLVAALRDLPAEQRGWQTERRSVQCQSCKAVMVYDPARVGQNCEFCGSPALVAYDEIKAPIRPQGVLPFRVDAGKIRDSIRAWWKSKWFAPNALSRSALVDTLRSVYIPYWTFDAQVHCPWQAEAGYHYYVPVQGVDSKGRAVTRMEQRTRWEPAAGVVDHAGGPSRLDPLTEGGHGPPGLPRDDQAPHGQRGQVQYGLTLDYYRELFINRRQSFFYVPPIDAARNSLLYAGATVLISVSQGFLAAYALTRRWKLNAVLDGGALPSCPTLADLRPTLKPIRWLWNGWLPRALLSMHNQREVTNSINLYAMDNDELYPPSVATVGFGDAWNWT